MSDLRGRTTTLRLASERNEDGFDWRGEASEDGGFQNDHHRGRLDNTADLLVEVGADGTGVLGMRGLIVLGSREGAVVDPSRRLMDFLMKRLVPGGIGTQHPKADQEQGTQDSAQEGNPVRISLCSHRLQSLCIKRIPTHRFNEKSQGRHFLWSQQTEFCGVHDSGTAMPVHIPPLPWNRG